MVLFCELILNLKRNIMNFKLPTQIMIAMVLGVVVGYFKENAIVFQPVGIFLFGC